jgi:hypothetical protein
MSDHKISKLHVINPHGVTVNLNKSNAPELWYNSRPLRCQTGLVNCPYGITDDGKLRITMYPQALTVLHELDNIIKELAPTMDLEHVPLTFTDDELSLTVIGSRTAFFDSNKIKIAPETVSGAEFTAYILLDLSKPYIYDGKIKLSILLLQVLVRTFSNLPPGCHVFNTLEELRAHTLTQSTPMLPVLEEEEVSVVAEDTSESSSSNELLDG